MKNIEFNFNEDMRLIRELMGLSQAEFAEMLHVEAVTVNRWENGSAGFSNDSLERLYMSAYRHGININKIKEQFFAEESDPIEKLLFHGAKTMIDGALDIDHAKERNDFGKGFYCGESFVQASLFVSGFPQSSVYIFEFDPEGLEHKRYEVDREWLLTIAAFRERLGRYSGNKLIGRLKEEANSADYIIAPIADNRMFQIIDEFIKGSITDEQCIHALAATDFGMQYVMKSEKALKRLVVLERCYLCGEEKRAYSNSRAEDIMNSDNKVNAARIKYRGKGKYIDELL